MEKEKTPLSVEPPPEYLVLTAKANVSDASNAIHQVTTILVKEILKLSEICREQRTQIDVLEKQLKEKR